MTQQPNNLFELDEDEAIHLNQIDQMSESYLHLANAAALNCAEAVATIGSKIRVGTPHFVMAILYAHGSRLTRAAVNLYYLGYYSAGDGILRASFESAAYARLIAKNPLALEGLLRAEFHPELEDRVRIQRTWRDAAKDAFLVGEGDFVDREQEIAQEIWEMGSSELHFSFESLADNFGIELADLIPDDIVTAISEGGNLAEVLDEAVESAKARARLSSRGFQVGRLRQPQNIDSQTSEPTYVSLLGQYEEERLAKGALKCAYLAHRLYDFAVGDLPVSQEAISQNEDWHQEMHHVMDG